MRCETVADSLGDLVDGTLAPDGQRAIERHLEGCAGCRALVADLRTIRAAAFTLEQREVPASVWPVLRARLAAERIPASRTERRGSRGASLHMWLAAAALVLATTAGIGSLVLRPTTDGPAAGGDGATIEGVQAELELAEAHYQKAIQGLEAIAQTDTGELDPQVAAVLRDNLQVIDRAIGESRAALQEQPASAPARASLFEGLRQKVALLQHTVELINEMRKGNQAESARLIQGLGAT